MQEELAGQQLGAKDQPSDMEAEPIPDPTYQVHVKCSNCGFDSGEELFEIELGTQVGWANCPICGCKTLGRIIDE